MGRTVSFAMLSSVQFSSIRILVGGSDNGLIRHRLEGAELQMEVTKEEERFRRLQALGQNVPTVDPDEIAKPKPVWNQTMLPQWATVRITGRGDRILFIDNFHREREICTDNKALRQKVSSLSKRAKFMRRDEFRCRTEEVINLIAEDATERSANWYFGEAKNETVTPGLIAKKRPVEDCFLDYLHTIRAAVSTAGKFTREWPGGLFRSPGWQAAVNDRRGYWPDLLK